MSGECDKCGEHALECKCGIGCDPPGSKIKCELFRPRDKFYYQGKFFEKEEDFWAYVKDFSSRQTSREDFESLFDMIKKDIWINLEMRQTKISNGELGATLEMAFLFILERCFNKDESVTK